MPLTPIEVYSVIAAEARKRGLLVKSEPLPVELLEQEAARRGLVHYDTFHDFVKSQNPTLLHYEHVPKLIDVGERIVQGVLQNTMVWLPPRYFKTEIFGKLLPAYYLLRYPFQFVGLTSYVAELAWDTSESAQNYYLRAHGQVHETVQAKRLWRTAQGGRMWALGMGAGITGRGFHIGITDDPIKPEDARSPLYQRRFMRWWPDTWLSRREPRAQLLLVMQRLGPEDPVDFLLRREVGEKTEKAPLNWHIVVLDEIKSEEPYGRWNGPMGLPPTCTLEPDSRRTGQVLAPARFDRKAVEAIHKQTGPLTTAAQRQQRPLQPTGDFWQSKWFGEYETLPSHAYNGGWDWDTALTKDEANSACAGIKSYRGPAKPDDPEQFDIYIDDVFWDWLEFPALIKQMKDLKGPYFVEAKASGKSAVQQLGTYGIKAEEVTVLGDKLARAAAVQPAVSNGRVLLSAKVTQKLLWGERQGLLRVSAEGLQMGGEGLDVNDAFVQAVTRHLGIGAKKKPQVRFR